VHRLGDVPVGEASVVVVVAAEHRAPAFDACRFLMDRLKNEVPIWKSERLRDGAGSRWVGDLPRRP
jgi:molybdopterin synthase catalytic subunit